ncbi:MAG TPA: carbohydrate kinase [Stellaceae bacterium]|nr:carbohydrate kinase [Stellaceae bacterium]
MIISCGEALIDFVPAHTEGGDAAYVPAVGGSPYNIAITMGRLGAPAGFLGGISTDFFGDQLIAGLRHSQVDTTLVRRLDRPSTLAFVSLGDGEPQYVFYDREAAHRFWDPPPGFILPEAVRALHFGSISLFGEPGADRFAALMAQQKGRRLLSLDPNIRPGMIEAEGPYRQRLEAMLRLADVIKVSAADLDWLAPGRTHESIAADWLRQGTALVVVTLGGEGAAAFRSGGSLRCPAEPVSVVDTVGAGDTFMGGLLAAMARIDCLNASALAALPDEVLRALIGVAIQAAGITCGRRGANPPWSDELPALQRLAPGPTA